MLTSNHPFTGVTAYGYALYCLIARDERGHGTPLAYLITSEDSTAIVAIFLQKLKASAEQHGTVFEPRYS
jgi:hypothetical protein